MRKITIQEFCDRCGKEITSERFTSYVIIGALAYKYQSCVGEASNTKEKITFCSDCAKEFLEWWLG
jgi:hypothetical protein